VGFLFAALAVFFWIAASSKPAQEWAQQAPKERPGKKGGKGGIETALVSATENRIAIKFGGYKVGYLVQRDSMWVALTLRGDEANRGPDRGVVVQTYIHSIGGGDPVVA
jgi:hypothetical protein